jgi:hypothetical protein
VIAGTAVDNWKRFNFESGIRGLSSKNIVYRLIARFVSNGKERESEGSTLSLLTVELGASDRNQTVSTLVSVFEVCSRFAPRTFTTTFWYWSLSMSSGPFCGFAVVPFEFWRRIRVPRERIVRN